jgi:uncharacterized membrane protein YdjX (TVP38/TMEM64 family)
MPPHHLTKFAKFVPPLLLVVATVVVTRYREEILGIFGPWLESLAGLGPWSYVLLTACYIPAAVCGVPVSFISPGVGFVLGPVSGFLVAILGVALGASMNYWIARGLGRRWFAGSALRNRKLLAVEIACRTRGFQVVALTRLTPVFPINLMSYFFGVTSVAFWPYFLATLVGMLPRTAMLIAVGTAAKSLTVTSKQPLQEQSLADGKVAVSLVLTVVACLWIAKIANRALQQALEAVEVEQEGAAPALVLPEPSTLRSVS